MNLSMVNEIIRVAKIQHCVTQTREVFNSRRFLDLKSLQQELERVERGINVSFSLSLSLSNETREVTLSRSPFSFSFLLWMLLFGIISLTQKRARNEIQSLRRRPPRRAFKIGKRKNSKNEWDLSFFVFVFVDVKNVPGRNDASRARRTDELLRLLLSEHFYCWLSRGCLCEY